jgi:hypothetical protein
MEKLDLRKNYKNLYQPSAKEVAVVEIPALQFAMIEGAIEPGQSPGISPAFQAAMEALYGISYTLKFMSKLRKQDSIDYTVMALEALWWVEDGHFDITQPDNWHWRAMILQPDHITPAMFAEGIEQVRKKRGGSPAIDRLHLETFCEGLCVQIMHLGPYSAEPPTVAKMEIYAAAHGYKMRGEHHEIYLGDPRRSDPAKLKTVLRHPIEKAG